MQSYEKNPILQGISGIISLLPIFPVSILVPIPSQAHSDSTVNSMKISLKTTKQID